MAESQPPSISVATAPPNVLSTSAKGTGFIGEVVETEQDDEPGHTGAQWQVAKIGQALGLDVWIPRADRHKIYRGEPLIELSVGTLPGLGLPPQAQTIVENIDVLWIDAGVVVCAFEIEHSTTVYSGLLRLSDLVTVQPYTSIRLFIVAATSRREKVMREVARPTFAKARPPPAQICRFLAYEQLEEHLLFAEQHGQYLRFDWVDSLGERSGVTGHS